MRTPRFFARPAVALLIAFAIGAGGGFVHRLYAHHSSESPLVRVRWAAGVDDVRRSALEQRHHLDNLGPHQAVSWNYGLRDTSVANVRALVQDAEVADTDGIDRVRFSVVQEQARWHDAWIAALLTGGYAALAWLLVQVVSGAMRSPVAPVRVGVMVVLAGAAFAAFVRIGGVEAESVAEAVRDLGPESVTGATGSDVDTDDAPTRLVDVERLIDIHSTADARERRRRLITFLWGRDRLPGLFPSRTLDRLDDRRFADLPNLSRIEMLTVTLDYGLTSRVYHFVPARGNGELVLYHEGHGDDFGRHRNDIGVLLNKGFAVAAFNMPLGGDSEHPVVDIPHLGPLALVSHDQFSLLAPAEGSPVKYFVEPVVAVVNEMTRRGLYRRMSMTGISGGGWTTVLAAAIDDRIAVSVPVAGSYPFHLRSRSSWGDWEQHARGLYDVANYLELYVLGAYGRGRSQLQIFNTHDPCCFAGDGWKSYRGAVRQRVAGLGAGTFDVWADDENREHSISSAALDHVIAAIGR